MAGVVDWSGLPNDLLERIVRKTTFLGDHLRFGSVCSSWRSVARYPQQLPNQLPGILLPGDGDGERRPLFEVGAPLVYLPVSNRYYCCGSKFGWLVLVDDDFSMHLFNPLSGQKFQLPHPTTIPSPRYSDASDSEEIYKEYMRKAIISCPPSNSTSPAQTLVFIICCYGRKIVFCRLGDQVWTPIKSIGTRLYKDAIYYNDKFYATYYPGGVVTFDIHDSTPRVIDYVYRPITEITAEMIYVVQSEGYLFLLIRKVGPPDPERDKDDSERDHCGCISAFTDYRNTYDIDEEIQAGNTDDNSDDEIQDDNTDDNSTGSVNDSENINHESDHAESGDDCKSGGEDESNQSSDDSRTSVEPVRFITRGFKVYRLKMTDDDCCPCEKKWEKVENIGDNAFFVGRYSTSFSLIASDVSGCKPNSIYFTEWEWEPKYHHIGVFNLEDKSVEDLYPTDSKPTVPHALWFTPAPFDPTPP